MGPGLAQKQRVENRIRVDKQRVVFYNFTMERSAASDLLNWIKSSGRKPLVLRGARQVGKTWLVRDLVRRVDLKLIELNFEYDPAWADCFVDNSPKRILERVGMRLGYRLEPTSILLFLDEIQAFGAGFAKLRWFAEKLPELPVVAAGSLLDFALSEHDFSMPVGRVGFYNLNPLGFDEFLFAHGQDLLLERLSEWRPASTLESVVHEQGALWMERFAMTGGMPWIASLDVEGRTSESIRSAQRQLMATYRADFSKYSGRMSADMLDKVLRAVAHQLGGKFVFSKVAANTVHRQVKAALELLVKARICQNVTFSAGNGIPLAAEAKDKFRKVGLLDVGLLHALVDTPATPTFPRLDELVPALRSKISEQLTVQQLRHLGAHDGDPSELFYWQREGGRPGEIDHLVEMHGRIIPLELKSGSAGSMKSLHQFVFDKRLDLAVRIDANPPSVMTVDVKTTLGDGVRYRLLSLPQYLLFNLKVILAGL